MDAFLGSDPKLLFAFWLGVAVTAMTFVMLGVIVVMRQVVLHKERVHANAVTFWRQHVVATGQVPEGGLPPLQRRDLSGFIEVWNEVHEALNGATTPYLRELAGAIGLQPYLYEMLASRRFHDHLLAIIALGHVRDPADFDAVLKFIDDRNPIVSLCAARALMQIDPQRAVTRFVPAIVHRTDWSQGTVARILQEAGSENVSEQLSEATLRANADIAPRLIRFLANINPQAAAPIIRRTILEAADERLISTCLQVMANPDDLDVVRPLLAHSRWHVRMQAAVTLGRLGVPGDEVRLVAMLSDPQWWVRYRAAQALTKLSFIDRETVRQIQHEQSDGYARDIIKHVLAEQVLGAAS